MGRAQDVLAELVRAVEADGFAAHGVHVLVGEEAAHRLWSADQRRDVHSVAKAVVVLAAGLAHDAGRFDVDAPVARHLPDLPLGEGVEEVTARHLLGMVSGVDLPWSPTLMTDWPDLAAEFLSRPSRGRVFQYSNASTYTVVRALETAVGDVRSWLLPRLFAPLGVDDPPWDRCPRGTVLGGEGLHLRIGELARLGRLLRDGGLWEGRRLVSRRWVDALHRDWTVREAAPAYSRYALAGWGGPGPAWRLHGAHGQLVVLLDDAVVTVTADDHAGADRMAERVVQALQR